MHITGQQVASLAQEIANGHHFTKITVHPYSGVITAEQGPHSRGDCVLINPDGIVAYRNYPR